MNRLGYISFKILKRFGK